MSSSISSNSIKKLALKASVGSIQSRVLEQIRTEIISVSEEICVKAELVCDMRNAKTISHGDVEVAINTIYYLHDMKLGEHAGKKPRNVKSCPDVASKTFGMRNRDKIVKRRVEKSKKMFNCFLLPKSVFKKLMDENTSENKRKSNDALIVFQETVENHIINVFSHAQKMNENKIMKNNTVVTAINMIKKQYGKTQETHKEKFDVYIRKVLYNVHPYTNISKDTLFQINSILNLIANRITSVSLNLCRLDKKSTISGKHVRDAVRLLLPGDLARIGVSELTKAIAKASSLRRVTTTNRVHAGLQFPPTRVGHFLTDHSSRTSAVSKIAMAAVLEYLSAELLELVGNVTKNQNKKTINVRHLFLAINNDEELSKLVNITLGYKIPLSGVY